MSIYTYLKRKILDFEEVMTLHVPTALPLGTRKKNTFVK